MHPLPDGWPCFWCFTAYWKGNNVKVTLARRLLVFVVMLQKESDRQCFQAVTLCVGSSISVHDIRRAFALPVRSVQHWVLVKLWVTLVLRPPELLRPIGAKECLGMTWVVSMEMMREQVRWQKVNIGVY